MLAAAGGGRRSVGVDLSGAMIDRARSELRRLEQLTPGIEAAFTVGDMRNLPELGDGEFAAAACIGNSLPHLLTPENLGSCLAELARVLRPGGPLVIQTVNYDGLDLPTPKRRFSLPVIRRDTPALLFERYYLRRPDGLLDFVVRLRLEDDRQPDGSSRELVRSAPLRPWLRAEVESHLVAAGFGAVIAYGGFDLQPHRNDAPALVLVAIRGGGCPPGGLMDSLRCGQSA